ncbi:MAG: hypothetical protein CVU97_03060, partial [Firmicutes bacterium HGW-Firmicutes-21]
MKKFIAVLLSIVLISTLSAVFVTADEESVDGFVFSISAVDTKVVAEGGLIITSQEALAASTAGWAILILCEKVEDNLYKAKSDVIAPTPAGATDLSTVIMGANDIVIVIHSATSNPDNAAQYPNVFSKLAALKIKAGNYFTLSGIDLTAKTATNGKATVSLTDPRETDEPPVEPPVDPISVYISNFNEKIGYGFTSIFTADFSGAESSVISTTAGNFAWVAYIIAEPGTVSGQFVITATGKHLSEGSLTIPNGGFIIAAHIDDRVANSEVHLKTLANRKELEKFAVGDIITLTGVNLTAGTLTESASADLFIDSGVTPPPPGDDWTNIMGDLVDDPGYVFDVTAPANYTPGQVVNVTITIKDIVPT